MYKFPSTFLLLGMLPPLSEDAISYCLLDLFLFPPILSIYHLPLGLQLPLQVDGPYVLFLVLALWLWSLFGVTCGYRIYENISSPPSLDSLPLGLWVSWPMSFLLFIIFFILEPPPWLKTTTTE